MKTKEKGQAMVEFALIIPIFLMIVFFIIEVAWIGYQKTVFTYTTRNVAWQLRLANHEEYVMNTGVTMYLESYEADNELQHNFLKEARENKTLMDLSKVKIHDSQITIYGGKRSMIYNNHENKKDGILYKTATMEISAKMDYIVDPLTPIGKSLFKEGLHLKKDIYKVRRGGQKSELR